MESHEVTGITQGYHVVCYLHQLINGTKKSDTSIVSSVLHWASSGLWSAKSWYLTCKQLRLTTPPVQRCSSLARQCEWQPLSCAGRHGSPWQEHWERTSVDGSALPPSWGTKVRPCILVTSLPSLLKNTKLHKLHQPSSKWVYLNENNPYLSSSCQTFSLQSGCPSPGKSRSLICIRELCQLPPSSFLGSHSLLLPCLGSISFCWVPGATLMAWSPQDAKAMCWDSVPWRGRPTSPSRDDVWCQNCCGCWWSLQNPWWNSTFWYLVLLCV